MKIVNIGRSSQNDIVISDNMVSKTHCQIIQDDRGQYRLIDINSTNGTYINGVQRRGEVVLSKTDIIRIGNETLPWQSYFTGSTVIGGAGGATVVGGGGYAPPMGGNNAGGNIINIGGGGNYQPQQTPPVAKPDNFLVWAILATIFCCMPFGIASIVNASKVDSRWATGDYNGAINAANSARIWFWWAFSIGLITCVVARVAIGSGF